MSPFSTGGTVDACDKRHVSVLGVTKVVVTNVFVTNDYNVVAPIYPLPDKS